MAAPNLTTAELVDLYRDPARAPYAARVRLSDGRHAVIRLADGYVSSAHPWPTVADGWPTTHHGPATYGHTDTYAPAPVLAAVRAAVEEATR